MPPRSVFLEGNLRRLIIAVAMFLSVGSAASAQCITCTPRAYFPLVRLDAARCDDIVVNGGAEQPWHSVLELPGWTASTIRVTDRWAYEGNHSVVLWAAASSSKIIQTTIPLPKRLASATLSYAAQKRGSRWTTEMGLEVLVTAGGRRTAVATWSSANAMDMLGQWVLRSHDITGIVKAGEPAELWFRTTDGSFAVDDEVLVDAVSLNVCSWQ